MPLAKFRANRSSHGGEKLDRTNKKNKKTYSNRSIPPILPYGGIIIIMIMCSVFVVVCWQTVYDGAGSHLVLRLNHTRIHPLRYTTVLCDICEALKYRTVDMKRVHQLQNTAADVINENEMKNSRIKITDTQGRLHHINDGANAPWKK